MTATHAPVLAHDVIVRVRRSRPRVTTVSVAIAIIGLALLLRLLRHSTNHELFVDEITYSNLGLSIADGHGVTLYGQAFFLHPPAFMYVLAGALELFGRPTTTLSLVMHLRVVNAVIGTIDVALMMLLTSRLVGRSWGWLAGLVMAVDPFLLLYDGRVMLETLATTATVAGMLAFLALGERLRAPDSFGLALRPGERARHYVLAVVAGLAFGLALLTKETYVFDGIAPVGVLFVTGWYVRRRWTGTVLVTAILCYAAYLTTVVLAGNLSAWWHQQDSGLLRAVGASQISGFNQSGHVGFVTRFMQTTSYYAGTYAFMALAAGSVAWGVRRWWRSGHRSELTAQEVLVVWAGCAGLFAAFSALHGAFEQQIFYPFLVVALPATVIAARSWTGRQAGFRGRVLPSAVIALLIAVLAYDSWVDVHVRTTSDAAYSEMVHWIAGHARPSDLVDATDGVSQFVLRGVRIETVNSLRGVLRDRPTYVIYSVPLVRQGYVKLTGGLKPYLRRFGKVAYRAYDTSIGPLIAYRLSWPASG